MVDLVKDKTLYDKIVWFKAWGWRIFFPSLGPFLFHIICFSSKVY